MKKEDLINEVMETKEKEYKVGQRVKVISGANIEEYNGKEGIIYDIDLESITQPNIKVRFEGNENIWCYSSDIYDFNVEILEEVDNNNKLIRRFPTELWDNEVVVNDNGLKYIKRDGVRVFETGSVRSLNDGRERYDLIPQLALDVAAKIFGKNIGQFGSGNHMEHCIPEKACIESLKRHLAAYTRYLEGYEDTNEDDAGSILTNALMLVHTIEMKKIGLYKIKYGKDI